MRDFEDSDISLFVSENAIEPSNGICRLTDNTTVEKQEIISWIANNGVIPELEYIYPALFYYLKDYSFECGTNSSVLTEYFNEYKQQKVLNKLFDGFEAKAHKLSLLYAHLDTREILFRKLTIKIPAGLYGLML